MGLHWGERGGGRGMPPTPASPPRSSSCRRTPGRHDLAIDLDTACFDQLSHLLGLQLSNHVSATFAQRLFFL